MGDAYEVMEATSTSGEPDVVTTPAGAEES
jgi:hypothetical protein